MEYIGVVASGVTLAALLKHCFEVLDLIQLYQTQDVDFNRLQLQYKLEKCRLYNWGVEMGLADDSKQSLLSEWHSKDLVDETLREVINLFRDGQVMRKKYGCQDEVAWSAPSLPAPESSHGIASAFNHFRLQPSKSGDRTSRVKRATWVIRDRKKFLILVSDIRCLVDSLEKITSDLSSTARLEEVLRMRINGITNADTLLGIAKVWKDSHPRVASAASTRADSISMSSGKYEFISQWQNSVDSEASGDTLIGDVEDLTITELKHSFISSNFKVESLEKSLNSTSESTKTLERQIYTLRDRMEVQKYAGIFVFLLATLSFLYFSQSLDIQLIKSLSWSKLTFQCFFSLLLVYPWILHLRFLYDRTSFFPFARQYYLYMKFFFTILALWYITLAAFFTWYHLEIITLASSLPIASFLPSFVFVSLCHILRTGGR